ncbi:hypothetical protein ACIRRX_32830 [Streptomyces bacillaris]
MTYEGRPRAAYGCCSCSKARLTVQRLAAPALLQLLHAVAAGGAQS